MLRSEGETNIIYRKKGVSLIDKPDKFRIKATIVFRSANTVRLRKWLKEGFSHCFIIIHHNGYNLLLDTAFSHSYTSMSYFDYEPQEGDTIVKIDRFIDTNVKYYKIGVMSCVEIVKRFIGLNEFFIFTPYQLYRRLKDGRSI